MDIQARLAELEKQLTSDFVIAQAEELITEEFILTERWTEMIGRASFTPEHRDAVLRQTKAYMRIVLPGCQPSSTRCAACHAGSAEYDR